MITVLKCFHFGPFKNFKYYYLFYVRVYLKKEFPKQLSYSHFVQLECNNTDSFSIISQLICFGECARIIFIDSTKIAICHNKRIKRNKVFKEMAEIGKNTTERFFKFKLHLICNDNGESLNFCITKGNMDDRNINVINQLSIELFGKPYSDKGYISAPLCELLFNDGMHLSTGIRSNMKNRLMTLQDKSSW